MKVYSHAMKVYSHARDRGLPKRHTRDDVRLVALAVLRHELDQRSQARMDGDIAHAVARFRRLQLVGLLVPRLRDVNDARVQVDVRPDDGSQFTGSQVEVAGERVELAPLDRQFALERSAEALRLLPKSFAERRTLLG
jgi:hypothetical protein